MTQFYRKMKRILMLYPILLAWGLGSDQNEASAHALTGGDWQPRYYDHLCNGTNYSVHWPHPGTLAVRLNTSATNGVQRIFKRGGGGATFSYQEVREQLELALVEFNESVGANIRLYVGADTTNVSEAGAIVISTSDDNPRSTLATGITFGQCGGAFHGRADYGEVTVHRYGAGNVRHEFSNYSNDDGQWDLWVNFTQEIGHAMGLHHADNSSVVDTQTPIPQNYAAPMALMMIAGLNQRHWTKYERETFPYAYGARVGFVKNYGGFGKTWSFIGSDLVIGFAPQFRNGRLSEGHGGVSKAFPEWGGNNPPGGPGVDGRLSSSASFTLYSNGPATHSPPAIAVDELNSDWRMFYLSQDIQTPSGNGVKPYGSAERYICYVTSTNGHSWSSSPTCLSNPSTGVLFTTRTDAVTASFDRYRKVFVVTWIDVDYYIRMLTIPGTGSPQANQVYSTPGHRSWEAPTIACRHSDPGCMMVFMAYAPTGYLKTLKGDVLANGTWSTTHNWSDYYDLDQSQTPSIAYRVKNDSFSLVYLKRDMKTIRAYRRYWADTTHWKDPATLHTSSTSVSAPSVGTWYSSDKISSFYVTFLEYQQ